MGIKVQKKQRKKIKVYRKQASKDGEPISGELWDVFLIPRKKHKKSLRSFTLQARRENSIRVSAC